MKVIDKCFTLFLLGILTFGAYDYNKHHEKKNAIIRKYEHVDYRNVIGEIKTPREAQDYCIYFIDGGKIVLDSDGYKIWNSFKTIHETRKGVCVDGAVAGTALLNDDRYETEICALFDSSVSKQGHAVCVYQDPETGKFGSIGINECDFNDAVFNSLDELECRLASLYKSNHFDMAFCFKLPGSETKDYKIKFTSENCLIKK
ncbi:MAG: hypothetical protein HZB65_01025 [Candidatus Aenigmarchaeota archaeon]|nr:hypothetical protein [Candidatus Aenigmarchaeota archaeon]